MYAYLPLRLTTQVVASTYADYLDIKSFPESQICQLSDSVIQ